MSTPLERLTECLGDLSNWLYVGGDHNLASENRWKLLIGKREYPAHECFCICGHYIENQCYIQNKKNPTDILVIGTVCVNRFMNKIKVCFSCGAEHKNRVTTLCDICRKGRRRKDLTSCPNCRWVYDRSISHSCEDVITCDKCAIKYIGGHTCPESIISCDKCFIDVKRNHICASNYLTNVITGGKYKGAKLGDIIIIDFDHVKTLEVYKHQSSFIDKVVTFKYFITQWDIKSKELCPDCCFICWPWHDCIGRILWKHGSEGECWGDLLARCPEEFKKMSIKYPILLPYIDAEPVWERKRDCAVCLLSVRMSKHNCDRFLYQVDERTDEMWGDRLKLDPTCAPIRHIGYVQEVLKYGLFMKVWSSAPRIECTKCFLDVREGHKCRGHLLLQTDKLYNNGVVGDILKKEPLYAKSEYLNRVLKSKYFDKWVSTPPEYCLDCFLFKGVHKCNGSILHTRINGVRIGDLLKNGTIFDDEFINEVRDSDYFFKYWELEPIIDCPDCFLSVGLNHKCMTQVLFRLRKRGKYAGYLYGDILKLNPKIIKLRGDELLYKNELLKSKLFNKWIVYPPVLCLKCFLTVSPIHKCRDELWLPFESGKYAGKRWGDILLSNPGYIAWTLEKFYLSNKSLTDYIIAVSNCNEFAKKWIKC
jgi:hypothetical protein